MLTRMFGGGLIREDEPQEAVHFPVVSTLCSITITASQRSTWLTKVTWSYDADPAAGSLLTVEDGVGNFKRKWAVTKGGPGGLTLLRCKGTPNTDMIVKLSASAGVIGTLMVEYIRRS